MRSPTAMLLVPVALAVAIASAFVMPQGAQAAPQDPCAPAFGSFSAGNWPPACWRPYSDASPFNVRVPPNPTLNPRSAQIVQRLVGFGPPTPERAGIADGGDDFGKPVYFAQPSDPVVTLNGSGSSPIDGERIHVPAGARPASGGDAHMTIVQANGWEYDLYRAQEPSGGVLNYSSGRKIRIDGDGLNSAATASRFGNLAGKVTEPELRAGVINHALVMTVNCTSGSFVWPAAKTDSRCSDPTDAPPMGAHFWLAMSDGQINALPVPAWKKTILRAAAHYGAFVGDSTSSPWSLLGFWSGTSYTSFGVADPMVAFAQSVGIKSERRHLLLPDRRRRGLGQQPARARPFGGARWRPLERRDPAPLGRVGEAAPLPRHVRQGVRRPAGTQGRARALQALQGRHGDRGRAAGNPRPQGRRALPQGDSRQPAGPALHPLQRRRHPQLQRQEGTEPAALRRSCEAQAAARRALPIGRRGKRCHRRPLAVQAHRLPHRPPLTAASGTAMRRPRSPTYYRVRGLPASLPGGPGASPVVGVAATEKSEVRP